MLARVKCNVWTFLPNIISLDTYILKSEDLDVGAIDSDWIT